MRVIKFKGYWKVSWNGEGVLCETIEAAVELLL